MNIPLDAQVAADLTSDKTPGRCHICQADKLISSWVTISMGQDTGEWQEFVAYFGQSTIKICFTCYAKSILTHIGP